MFPIRMIYKNLNQTYLVDVYYFHSELGVDDSGNECIFSLATCWILDNKCWITVPVFQLTPMENKTLIE